MASRFVKPKALRAYILEVAATRHKKWTRVALAEWLEYVNAAITNMVDGAVSSAPTMGKTLYPPVRRSE